MFDLFGRYVFRQAASALVLILLVLTAIVWLATALKELDLLTSKGQGLVIFFNITVLALPNLMAVIAPNALLMAALYTLDRLNGDSELIVVTASGAPVWRVAAPFLLLAGIVSAALVVVNFWALPASLRALQAYVAQVRTDLIAQVLQPGRFSSPEPRLTFHIRDRGADGDLLGLMVHDARERDQVMTYLAKRGRIMHGDGRDLLVMQGGQIHRQTDARDEQSVQIVEFEQYVFDITQFGSDDDSLDLKPRERYLSELLNPDPNDPYYRRNPLHFTAEIHNRFTGILYPFVYVAIAVAFVGQARTVRESRWRGVILAFAAAVAMRMLGLAALNLHTLRAEAAVLVYAVPIGAILVAGLAAHARMTPHTRLGLGAGLTARLALYNNNFRALRGMPAERRHGRVG